MGVGEIDRGAEMMLGEVPSYYAANNNYVRIARERGDRKDFQPDIKPLHSPFEGTLGIKTIQGQQVRYSKKGARWGGGARSILYSLRPKSNLEFYS